MPTQGQEIVPRTRPDLDTNLSATHAAVLALVTNGFLVLLTAGRL